VPTDFSAPSHAALASAKRMATTSGASLHLRHVLDDPLRLMRRKFSAPLGPWAIPTALTLSLLLCTAGWPEARLGLVANAVIARLLVWIRSGAVA
jgi:hypothetical protein